MLRILQRSGYSSREKLFIVRINNIYPHWQCWWYLSNITTLTGITALASPQNSVKPIGLVVPSSLSLPVRKAISYLTGVPWQSCWLGIRGLLKRAFVGKSNRISFWLSARSPFACHPRSTGQAWALPQLLSFCPGALRRHWQARPYVNQHEELKIHCSQ